MKATFLHDVLAAFYTRKSVRYLALAIVVLFAVMASFGIHHYLLVRQARLAQQALADSLAEFDKTMQAEHSQQKWSDVVRAFDTAYQRYGNTSLGASFLAYKAQALTYDQKFSEALETMKRSVALLKKSSPLYYVYATKLALMKTDSPDSAVKAEGEKDLELLAKNPQNTQRDQALYYAGLYSSMRGDQVKSKSFWAPLLTDEYKDSIWSSYVKQKYGLVR